MSLKKTNNTIDKEIYIGPKEYPIKIQIKTYKGRKYLDIRKRNIHKMKAIPVCIIKDKN